ncbi:hypothetical protein MYU51_003363 [Penicillium brevicompactum]|uniref:uncharacterized protein n=1 Tax=Penicillium brevicompactum TaxID=5074 RepID=UPI0025423C06|nr:uncharacterized protein N7506_002570 [Penicillium brevicompactum]KAJ5344205.1 hypothetical protein N7506_002570 [Penicillium brevicompactum]
MPYRFELAKSGRSGCQTKECKDAQTKIAKGELRIGTWVDNESRQFWMWRHWGCFTPRMVQNVVESIKDGDDDGALNYELLDGWEDLTNEYKDKISQTLERGHVDDEDWRGDIECNRPGGSGMRVKVKAAKGAKGAKKDKEPQESSAAGKKRGVSDAEVSDVGDKDEPAKKKRGPGRPKKENAQVDNGEEAVTAPKKAGRPKKPADDNADAAADSQPKKRGRTAKKVVDHKESSDEDVEMPDAEEAQPAKPKATSRARAAAASKSKGDSQAAEEGSAPQNDAEESNEPADNKEKPKRGRSRKPAAPKATEEPAEKAKAKPGRKPAASKATEEPVPGNTEQDKGQTEPAEKAKAKRGRKAAASKAVEDGVPENNDQQDQESAEIKPAGKRGRSRKPAGAKVAEDPDKPSDEVSLDQSGSNGHTNAEDQPVAELNAAEPIASGVEQLFMDNGTDVNDKTAEPAKEVADVQLAPDNTNSEAVVGAETVQTA